jgi:excisionase family DNA binding protein
MNTKTQDPILMNTREAARALSISERKLWDLTAPRGPIPSLKFGRSVRYRPEDLREWAAKATTKMEGA